MLNNTLAEDILSLEEEMTSRSSSRSSKTLCKLNGKAEAGCLLQLTRDNILLAVAMKAPKKVATELNESHLFIQNRFRVHLKQTVFPEIIRTSSTVPSTSKTAPLTTTTHNLPAIAIDFKKFIDNLEDVLGQNNQIPIIQASTEARAIILFIANVERIMNSKGFQSESILAVKNQRLTLQADFLDYLADEDGRVRINEIMKYIV